MKSVISKKTEELQAAKSAKHSQIIREIDALYNDVEIHVRAGIASALCIGLRLLYLHRETGEAETPGGFRAALSRLSDRVAPSTAYRWINAASAILARVQGITNTDGSFDPEEITLPDPGSKEWIKLEKQLTESTKGMSMRRLLIGSSATSDESRMDSLIAASESGDPYADEILDRVAKGELTLVQAIRAIGGTITKDKERRDPVYLNIDGATGRLTGLFPKCVVTLANTFAKWNELDEAARAEARKVWKSLALNLPKDLR